MSDREWLLLGTCALGLYGAGQVWLVQLSSYRLWTYVGANEFRAYMQHGGAAYGVSSLRRRRR